jgi:hypothetical protein
LARVTLSLRAMSDYVGVPVADKTSVERKLLGTIGRRSRRLQCGR